MSIAPWLRYCQAKKSPAFLQSFLVFGSPSWARTSDKRINSPLLYQLSYQGIEIKDDVFEGRYPTVLRLVGQY